MNKEGVVLVGPEKMSSSEEERQLAKCMSSSEEERQLVNFVH